MKSPTYSLGSGLTRLLAVILYTGGFSSWALPGVTQQAIEVVNTATGNFKPSAATNTPAQNVTSNSTVLTATPSGRPGLELVKTGDRSAAEPGDTVLYRLLITNRGTAAANNITVRDTLPLGLQYVSKSARGSLSNSGTSTPVTISATTPGNSTVLFSYAGTLAPGQSLTLVYGALLSPDSLRGTGRNLAVAEGIGSGGRITSNTSSHQLRIRSGILTDCGTILGKVFVDKNFDGEQQPGEPGVPNAVIFMDDGNRITTDANGMYSLQYAIAGYRTGTLDLTSMPGYTIAPNKYRIEGNSPSRLVKLAPGSTVRMNFAVTPTYGEGRR
jgi:uncharacterized repeat protein (TIGR01451 family)